MSSKYSSTNESMASILQAMKDYFPDTLEAVQGTYPGQAQSEFDITKEFTPQYAELQYDTLNNQGRKLSELGRELSKEEQLGAAQTELDIARGSGRDLAKEALSLSELVDPEASGARKALGVGVQKSLSAIDPTALTDGEIESISRGLGRDAYSVGSPMESLNSAMTFGEAGKARREEYRNTLTDAAGVTPALRTGISGFETATRRSTTPNWGQQNYTSIQMPGVNTANQFGQGYMNNATSIENTTKQKQKSGLDQFSQIAEGIGSLGSAFSI